MILHQHDFTPTYFPLLASIFPTENTSQTKQLNSMIEQTTGKMCTYKNLFSGNVNGQDANTWRVIHFATEYDT